MIVVLLLNYLILLYWVNKNITIVSGSWIINILMLHENINGFPIDCFEI